MWNRPLCVDKKAPPKHQPHSEYILLYEYSKKGWSPLKLILKHDHYSGLMAGKHGETRIMSRTRSKDELY